jgi:hypothetical protein
MFILISIFVLGLSIIARWISVVFFTLFFNLPGLLWSLFFAASGVGLAFLSLVCLWSGFKILKLVWKWVAGLVFRLVGLIWALIRGIFDLICWIFGYREKNVLVESPKKVRFEGI